MKSKVNKKFTYNGQIDIEPRIASIKVCNPSLRD